VGWLRTNQTVLFIRKHRMAEGLLEEVDRINQIVEGLLSSQKPDRTGLSIPISIVKGHKASGTPRES